MSPSVAKGLLNLQVLWIQEGESVEEVITKEEGFMILFPRLEILKLHELPKLGHFFLTEHALEFPFLKEVIIDDCPEMKTFVKQGISVSTPSLKSVNFDHEDVKVDDLNKSIQQRNKKLVIATKLNLVMAEIRKVNLSPDLFAKKSLLSIASAVGKPVVIDKATQIKSRPSTARVKVILDLMEKLPNHIRLQFVDGKS
ncbi:hypothetical protein H5410_054209, partial [Solanum commersonii]